MGLKGDIEEVSQVWDVAPWRVRLYLVISVFLATSGVASLSETVFRWKGFILDGVSLYREWIGEPLLSFFSQVVFSNKPITPSFADYAFVVTVVYAANIRMGSISGMPRSTQFAIAVVGINQLIGLAALEGSWLQSWVAWSIYALLFLAILFGERGAKRILGIAYMSAPFLVLSILAAINLGLSRTQ